MSDIEVRVINRHQSFLIFQGNDPTYSASVEVMRIGDRGMTASLVGKRFYEAISKNGREIMKEAGLKVLYGGVSRTHYRLLYQSLSEIFDVFHDGFVEIDGKSLFWVRLTIK